MLLDLLHCFTAKLCKSPVRLILKTQHVSVKFSDSQKKQSDFLVSAALGGVPVHHRDLHPGTRSARPQGKPGDDFGLEAVHSGETHTHTL